MTPVQLTAGSFASYPPVARQVAIDHVELLRQLPLSFLPSLLRELVEYDYKFPVERMQFDRQLATLAALPPTQRAEWFEAFSKIRLTPAHAASDWAGRPMDFMEEFSAFLWQTHQMDAFRAAAATYGERMQAALSPVLPVMRRLGIAVIGQGATHAESPLFAQLRLHGTLFTHVDPKDGLLHLLMAAESRARQFPAPYAHWYIDGGTPLPHTGALTAISYSQLAPVRMALLEDIQREVSKVGMGPEALRDYLIHLTPAKLGMGGDAVLDRFQIKVLTEGSGTQIFSTTFAQWATREALRRAEACTMLVRFAPRQRQRPMNELLSTGDAIPEPDPQGSLVDADMAAYYHWINQQRLSGAQQGSFLVWFEGQQQALAVSPSLSQKTTSDTNITLGSLISLIGA